MTRNLLVAILAGTVMGTAVATNEWRFIWAAIFGEAVFFMVWVGLALAGKQAWRDFPWAG